MSWVGAGLFFRACSEGKRINGLKLREGRFRIDGRNIFFTVIMVGHRNSLPREMAESPAHEVPGSGTGRGGLEV